MGIASALGFDRAREQPQIDPRDHVPNAAPPVGTVGPNVPAGFGDSHVMYPAGGWHAEAWAGWPTDWGTPPLEFGTDYWSGFGYGRQDPDGYMGRVSTVMTCVDRNSSQLASFPTYGVDGTAAIDLPQWARNPLPGMYSDWSDFALEVGNAMQLDGEAIVYAVDRYADGYPAEFMCLPGRSVDVDYDRDRGRFVYTWDGDEIRTRDVLHIRYQKMPGRFRGVGPLEWSYGHLVSSSILADYAADIAKYGVSAILRHPSNMNAKQRDDARANWMMARRAAGGAPAIVSGGWEYDTLTMSPADMALLDLRVLDDQRLAAAFRIQPYLVGIEQPGSMTYDNAALVGDHHWRIGLRPLAKKVATALSAWALPGRRRLEFNRDEYVEPGLTERAPTYATLHNIVDDDGQRAMTVAEIRARERFTEPAGTSTSTSTALIGNNP